MPRWLGVVFGVLLACAVYRFVVGCWGSPEGGWDAWAIWNLRARFLYRGGEHWAATFPPFIPWSHPDYPLLVPLSVARGWWFEQRETALVPQLVGGLFTFGTLGLLVAGLTLLRGATQALLAGCVLLGTVEFIDLGHAQYADVPLGYYLLAVSVLLALHERRPALGLVALAGLLAGFAAWTKNEGAMFVLAVVGVRLAAPRDLLALAVGVLVPLAVLIHFKVTLAPPNDIVAEGGLVKRLGDPMQYLVIAREFLRQFWLLGPGASLVLLGYGLLVGARQDSRDRVSVWRLGAMLVLMLAGYFVVYLNSPWDDVVLHIGTSLDRLLLQLWPTVVFAFFLGAATPGEARAA